MLVAAAILPSAAKAAQDCARPVQGAITLGLAELRMESCNREIATARAALSGAVADSIIAAQRPNPKLTVGVDNVNPTAGIGSGNLREKTMDSLVRLEQVFERGDKGRLREEQASAAQTAARFDLAEQVRQQRLAVRNAFFDLAAAQERERLQRDSAGLSGESERAARRRFESGEISAAEASRIRLDALRAANDARQATAERTRARNEFARTIGAEPWAAAIEVVPEWPEAEGVRFPGIRPDVAAARHKQQAASAGAQLARAIGTRDVTVELGANRWPTSPTNMQGTGTSYGVSFSIPLYVRHANEGEAARALADQETARLALERAEASQDADRSLAEEDLAAARERRKRVESEVAPAAREVARGAEFSYSKGASGVLDLLDARRSLKAVELDEVQARADAAKAWARAEAAWETMPE